VPAVGQHSSLSEVIVALAHAPSAVVTLPGGRRAKASRGTFMDRGFSRTFLLIEELTEELRQAEKAAYEKLIRMLSHEVNNSVAASNSLLTSCLVLAEQLPGESRTDLEGALHVVMNRTSQLGAFMKAFADVVRLPEPRLELCRIDELLRDILTLLRPELESRGIRAQLSVDSGFEPLRCDKNQIEQALINVIRNSIEAIGTNGTIDMALRREGRRQALSISDSGPGMPADVLPRLFAPFFSTKRDGRGLGLTLVQEVLKQHHFDYRLQNSATGGAEFRITF
jgi:signal transduction histidine kinase